MNQIIFGDCRETMRQLAKDGVKVQTCITSPPYYGLRDYGTGTWVGGDTSCSHQGKSLGNNRNFLHEDGRKSNNENLSTSTCIKCGAIRKDLQIGLEETVDEYVQSIVNVFACVWDILEDDGTLWLNLGDSYYNYRAGKGQSLNKQTISSGSQDLPETCPRRAFKQDGLKEKDLIGIPWRVAFALQKFGWYLRQDIIWHKPNPMPESVQDRCTKAHEYIFLLSKKPKYYFDNDSIREPHKRLWDDSNGGNLSDEGHKKNGKIEEKNTHPKGYPLPNELGANKRSVWTVTTKPYSGAHFATFPEDLIEPCVLAGSRVGDIVLDPFMGSGTTAQVAQKLGRKYIGCELNPEYKKLQDERLSQTSMELL